ncbi:MAG: helix-turn-helix domain-containing protein [Oscillospiraceae bacterium]|nr:helix-turn-helix domain-containing protein [Oscillospiraceae bacterium]
MDELALEKQELTLENKKINRIYLRTVGKKQPIVYEGLEEIYLILSDPADVNESELDKEEKQTVKYIVKTFTKNPPKVAEGMDTIVLILSDPIVKEGRQFNKVKIEVVEEIYKMLDANYSVSQIADAVGVSRQTIYNYKNKRESE